jgi:enamine deaminase RidA (YjgF/YER057c/UK114 family)
MYEEKLKGMGLVIPPSPEPIASYVPAVKIGNIIYTSGQIPIVNGKLKYKGKVGINLTEEEAYEATKICCLNCLSVIKGEIYSLDNIEKIIKITGYINSAPGFTGQSKVLNGASDLLGEVFENVGEHVRVAVGVCELPANAAVELEMMVKIKEA